jgi:hypothetical protein
MIDKDWLTKKLLQDRELAKQREAVRREPRERLEPDFDPFQITKWKIVAGGDPGYLPKTSMRQTSRGFQFFCKVCGENFESLGWACCPKCMQLPAEERRAIKPVAQGRLCQAPNCEKFLPRNARANKRFCSRACADRANYSVVKSRTR